MSVGKNIKIRRIAMDLSQLELAKQAEVSQSMLSQIEKGTKNPSLQVAYEIAKVLKCDVNEFMEESIIPFLTGRKSDDMGAKRKEWENERRKRFECKNKKAHGRTIRIVSPWVAQKFINRRIGSN